jgi:YebC/PmpR family DNA-binding regulatory protein
MSGHSKWATIKRKKGAADAARGRMFTRLIREISIAARQGGGDPTGNPRLRTAIAAAKAANMPKDNIERAIKKGTGELEGTTYEEIVYEGYGPYGVAVLAETVTDNRNRTASEIRHVFTKYGGNLGAVGSVAWMFEQKGSITVDRSRVTEEALLEAAMEAGAEDVITDEEDTYRVITAAADLNDVVQSLEEKGVPIDEASLDRVAKTLKTLTEDEAEKFLKFYEALEEHDDVQKLFGNFEIPDEVMEKMGG